jgi:hypothetical protein
MMCISVAANSFPGFHEDFPRAVEKAAHASLLDHGSLGAPTCLSQPGVSQHRHLRQPR